VSSLVAADISTVKYSERENAFSENDYNRFRELVRAKSGIFFPDRRRADLKTGVLKAFHYSGLKSLNDYYLTLTEQPSSGALFKTLVSFLTVGETYFFRHFDVIEKEILPRLIKAHQHDKTLRIWSAGCSTGEEPYTVAMVLHHLLPNLKEWNISIFGSDINVDSVKYAKEGVYRPWSLRSINEFYKNRYFTKREGLYYLNPDVQDMVRFDYMNLVEDCYPAADNGTMDLDMIFCRNVTIYFEAETTIKVINRFHRAIKERAYLAVGHAEPSSLIYDDYIAEVYSDAVIYRKDSSAKKEMMYQTGIKTRKSFLNNFSTTLSQTTDSIATRLDDLQKQLSKLKEPEKKKEEATLVRKKLMKQSESIAAENKTAKGESGERRADWNESEFFARGIELFQQKDFVTSEKVFTEIIEANPSNARALFMMAHLCANMDQISRAKEYCERAIDKDSLLIQAYYLLGLIFKEENAFDDSIKMLKKAIYIDMNLAVAYYDLAVNYFKIGDTVQGKKYLRQTEKILRPKSPEECVGIIDDMTVQELKLMVQMWDK